MSRPGRLLRCVVLLVATGSWASAQPSIQELRELEEKFAANPKNPSAIVALAYSYALALIQSSPSVAEYAESALKKSDNVWILGNVAYRLQAEHNQMLQRGNSHLRTTQLAEHYFQRAKQLAPQLERRNILPQLDLQKLAETRKQQEEERQQMEKRFDEAAKQIRRLPPAAFPNLPTAVASVLRKRGCTIPQLAVDKSPHNVIRGDFLRRGQLSWAVLCSVNQSSSILVFRAADDVAPYTLAEAADKNYLQGIDQHTIGYSRFISPAGRVFILSHANSAVKTPRIDHDGINDGFAEKGSSVFYFHEGKWMTLPGAD